MVLYQAAGNGHAEIVKILVPLPANPNAPNNKGLTPSSVAQSAKIRRILENINTSRKHNAAGPSGKLSKKFKIAKA